MSLRHGITAQEEQTLKRLIAEGKTWKEVEADTRKGENGNGWLQDVLLSKVKPIFEQLEEKHLEAADLGYEDSTQHDRAVANHKTKEKARARENQERILAGLKPLAEVGPLKHPSDLEDEAKKKQGGKVPPSSSVTPKPTGLE